MLLTTLIPTEITNFDIKILNNFLDICQNKSLKLKSLKSYLIDEKFSGFEKWVFDNSIKKIDYICEIVGDGFHNDAESQDTNCLLCNRPITSDFHNFDIYYELPIEYIQNFRQEIKTILEQKYLSIDCEQNFIQLKSEIEEIIPFIGAGLSMPFGLPSWNGLLKKEEFQDSFPKNKSHLRDMYLEYEAAGDLLTALDHLKTHSIYVNTDKQIKDKIINIIDNSFNKDISHDEHNIFDLLELNSNLYITTNYDLSLEHFLASSSDYRVPLCTKDIDNLKKLLKQDKQVLHLHGHIKRKETMIVSNKDYSDLYSDDNFIVTLNSILANRSLLYIGFSFTDKFFVNLYEKFNDILDNHHYIIIPNPTLDTIRKFNKKNLKVLGFNLPYTSDGSLDYKEYIIAFRTLIQFLKK